MRKHKYPQGIRRVPKRSWPLHRAFVADQPCAVPKCTSPAMCAHLRTAANSGMRLKPHDWFTVPLCFIHHCEQEGRTRSFQLRHHVDLWALAAKLAEESPDEAMKKDMGK